MPTIEITPGDRVQFLDSQGALASEFSYDENGGAIVLQDDQGNPADQTVGALEAGRTSEADDLDSDFPITAVQNEEDNEVVAQASGEPPTTTGDFQNRYTGYKMADRNGYIMGELVGDVLDDPGHEHLSLYVRGNPLGSGSKAATTKRMNVDYGAKTGVVDFVNNSKFEINNQEDNENTLLKIFAGGSNSSAKTELRNSAGGILTIANKPTNVVDFFHDALVGSMMKMEAGEKTQGAVDFQGNEVRGLREVGAQPIQTDIAFGEWAFTADRDGNGQAAWIYRDESGVAHYLDTDGTL